MQRRTLLKGTAVAGVAALGAGFWALPGGGARARLSLAAAQQVLADLQGRALQSLRGWPSEVFNHCARSIDYSIRRLPRLNPGLPAWFRHSLGPAAVRRVQRTRRRRRLGEPHAAPARRPIPARLRCSSRTARKPRCSGCAAPSCVSPHTRASCSRISPTVR
uniref:Twin-arginine translocation signal domain-containing protein n=1 Tax=Ectopseudomonas oleovorans TaxID=301 RepID=A0A653AXD7_ECTOL